MADCDPRAEILVTGHRGRGYEFAESLSVWQIGFEPLNKSRMSGVFVCVASFTAGE